MTDIAHHPLTNYQPVTRSRPVPLLARLGATLRLWRKRWREREQLARLGERELRDIGLSRSAIYDELRKPFWRA